MIYLPAFKLTTFIIITRIKSINGKPCNTTSNQSIKAMPLAPPKIHFNLPTICGSGKKGAKPKVRHSRIISFQLFMNSFKLSY